MAETPRPRKRKRRGTVSAEINARKHANQAARPRVVTPPKEESRDWYRDPTGLFAEMAKRL